MSSVTARILVTRAMPEAEETAQALAALGHLAILAPLREAESIATPFPAEKPAALITTSRNALVHGTLFPADWLKLPVFCVGESTADAARTAGFPDIRTAGGDASSLAGKITGDCKAGSRLVYLAGEPRGPELEASLQRGGFEVEALLRYRMHRLAMLPESAARALATHSVEAVLHFSAESARVFFFLAQSAGLLNAASALPQFCMSEAVADAAAAEAGRKLKCIIAPERHGGSLLATLHREFG